MKTLRPVNQKSIYHSYGDLYEKIMNDECDIAKAEQAAHALDGMNRTYALEIKRAEVENMLKGNSEKTEIRVVETKNFDQIQIEDKAQE
jgi:hypothetical protein